MKKMHVKVDLEACQGHGLCYFAAEALYEIRDSDGRAIVLLDPVPDDMHEAARKSADVCPERAITIIEE
jgi:ferredoxin